jgi:DNA-binding XRE family transcriptional regulator
MASEVPPPKQNIAELLRSYRVAAGLTLDELAARSGLSARTLGDIERNRTARPYRSSVERLADALRLCGPTRQHFFDTARGHSVGLAMAAGFRQPADRGQAGHAGAGPLTARTGRPRAALARLAQLVPRQMPATVPYFAGRDSELSTLARLLCSAPEAFGAQVAVITGTAGVGKSALALHWAYGVAEQFPDGQLYLNLRGFDPSGNPVTPAEAIRGFLAAFGIPDERIPANPEVQAALYRTVLADRKVLLVLDNAHDAAQVRPLLPGSPACRVVVTSRNQLAGLLVTAGARLLCLDVLPPGEAGEMLALRLGDSRLDKDREAVDALLTLTARLPLALAIVAARGAVRQDFPLVRLAAGLAEAGSRLDNLDAGDTEANIRTVFSWSYQNLTDLAARMFRFLGLHPGPEVALRAAASLAGLPLGQAEKALTELTTASMLTEHVPGRYSFNDLLREYAAEQCCLTDNETERRMATQRGHVQGDGV